MKVVIGPMNIASQPHYLAQGLRDHGVDAVSVGYGQQSYLYPVDHQVALPRKNSERIRTFYNVLRHYLENDFDIFHFFQRPFFISIPPRNHDEFLGFELPMIKARGKRVAYRFTGWDLIDSALDLRNNKYSALKYGWDGLYNPMLKKEFLNYLKCYCDAFMVVDPMMKEHCPEAEIIPRVLPVDQFDEVGIEKNDNPLIIHAPSNHTVKGSKIILKALKDLKKEGLQFRVKLLSNVPFETALEWYKKADIVIDQILMGWYGVLATECMAMGKPVAVYMREDLVKTPEEVPIHNINPGNIKEQLRILINDYSLREALARRGRAYVQSVHDSAVVIPKLISVYEAMLSKPRSEVNSYDDIEYFMLQRMEADRQKRLVRVALKNTSKRILNAVKQKVGGRPVTKWIK